MKSGIEPCSEWSAPAGAPFSPPQIPGVAFGCRSRVTDQVKAMKCVGGGKGQWRCRSILAVDIRWALSLIVDDCLNHLSC